MSGELEAAGTAIEGALLGAAVDGAPGVGSAHGSGACLNCGAQLSGPYCAQCGQQAHVHRTLAAIWHDILHSVLHFDGKFWRTLPLLTLRPGELIAARQGVEAWEVYIENIRAGDARFDSALDEMRRRTADGER